MLGRCACQVDLNVFCYFLFAECISSALSLPLSSSSLFYSLVLLSGGNCHDSSAPSSPTLFPVCATLICGDFCIYASHRLYIHFLFACIPSLVGCNLATAPPPNGSLVVSNREVRHISPLPSHFEVHFTLRAIVPALNRSSLNFRRDKNHHLISCHMPLTDACSLPHFTSRFQSPMGLCGIKR